MNSKSPILVSILIVLLIGMFSPAAAYQPKAASEFSKVDEYVVSTMKELNIPGIAVGIVRGDRVLYLQGYGVADANRRLVTPQTPFMIGSLSKSITALAVVQLVEQGKIDLDAPVIAYLPWFRLADADDTAQITVRHLLNQTSGIPGSAAGNYGDDKTSAEEFVRGLSALDLIVPVSSMFQYSDANYVILGLIVEKVSGLAYAEYFQRNIFLPLEMKHSFVSKDIAAQNGLSVGYRTAFGFPVPADLPYPQRYLPSGLVISSAEDLAHYMLLFLNGGKFQSSSIVSAESVLELQRPAVELEHPEGYFYGMGWFVNDQYRTHTGELSNYYAIMQLTPADQTGVVVLANANNKLVTGEYTQVIATGISELLNGREAPQPGNGFRQIYLIFDLVVLAIALSLLGRLIFSISRLRKKTKNQNAGLFSRLLALVGVDMLVLGLLGGVFFYLLSAFRTSLSNAMLGQPDIVIAFFLLIGLAFINVLTRLTFTSLHRA